MVFNKRFTKHFAKVIPFVICGISLLVMVDIFQLKLPEIAGDIITTFKKGQGLNVVSGGAGHIGAINSNIEIIKQEIFRLIKLLIIYSGTILIGRVLWRVYIFGSSRAVDYGIRNDMFEHATKLSQNFYSEHKVGSLMSLFIVDVEAIRMVYGPGILQFVDGTFLLGLTLTKMFLINIKLTCLALIPTLFLFILLMYLRRSMHDKFKDKQKSFENMSDFVQETVSGMAVVKAYVREAFEVLRFNRVKEDYMKKDYDHGKVQKKFWVISFTIISATFASIIAYGSYLIVFGGLPLGKLIVFMSFFGTLNWPVRAIVELIQLINNGNASAKRIIDFLEAPIDIKDSKDVIKTKSALNGDITFNNVSFNYPGDSNIVLNNLNFTIKKGESVGVLGKTGSGKTTIVELILRLYNVEKGKITIGGTDISKAPIKKVRDAIGYVPQDNFLFSDTIKNNVAFACDDVTENEIIQATKMSAVYDNITSFVGGFETKLGERGTTISGGQKQRISIARAIIKNPNILILDDAVSAVDVETEKEILANLNEFRKNKTTILIAHRISTIKDLDKIILLDNGNILAIGNHKELMEKSGTYREMVELQTAEDELIK